MYVAVHNAQVGISNYKTFENALKKVEENIQQIERTIEQ